MTTGPGSADARAAFLAGLPEALLGAWTGAELELATRPPAEVGIRRTAEADDLRIDLRLVRSILPRVVLRFDPPVDARELAGAWGIERPVGVAADVHQRRWRLLIGGRELPDPYGPRIAAASPSIGRWRVDLPLLARPPGDLPRLAAGASPAYDLRDRGGAIAAVEIALEQPPTTEVDAGHPETRALRARLAEAYPSRRSGWQVPPATPFVLIERDGRPVAGAAIRALPGEVASATGLCLLVGGGEGRAGDGRPDLAGAALLDVLESLAREAGAPEIRLEDRAFLYGPALPVTRFGYRGAPPYAGDADVPTWAAKSLAEPDPTRL